MPQTDTTASLYIVATPIGNLEDISERAIKTLQFADLIVAEDTRHSQKLLNHFNINKPLASLHAHNEATKSDEFIKLIQNGQNIALISDAGTPLISDPGYPLVYQARQAGITVYPIPGACAVTTALSASGLPCDKFYFEGFLPAKASARRQRLTELAKQEVTTVVYESTHRIIASLEDMQTCFCAERQIVLAKELTKQFESFVNGTVSDILAWLNQDTKRQQGEFVIIITGEKQADSNEENLTTILKPLLEELPLKQAVKLTTAISGAKKNTVYQLALTLT